MTITRPIREWWWRTARQRYAIELLTLFYAVGWAVGRASGKIQALERLGASAGTRDT